MLARRSHRGRPALPEGQAPKRCAINVPIDTYIAVCGIADRLDTSMRGVLELVLADLPPVER